MMGMSTSPLRRGASLALTFSLLLAFTFFARVLVGAAFANLGRIAFIRTLEMENGVSFSLLTGPAPDTGNLPALGLGAGHLQRALGIANLGPRLAAHLAWVYFLMGERRLAADILPSDLTNVGGVWRNGCYEYHLVRGWQAVRHARWEEAVSQLRLGIALGIARILPQDEEIFFLALGNSWATRWNSGESDVRAAYLAGKFFLQAGRLVEAQGWLTKAVALLQDPAEQASAYVALGLTRERLGDLESARAAYEQAISLTSNNVEAHLRLARILDATGDRHLSEAYAEAAAAIGPRYRLGRQGDGFARTTPKVLQNGWHLVGFDVDQDFLEAGAPLEVTLWWQPPMGTHPQGTQGMSVGEYWVQRQKVYNLAPNAGFEWDEPHVGLPTGYPEEFYGATFGSVSVVQDVREGCLTNVLRLDGRFSPNVGLPGFEVPVDPQGLYLMAGWKRDPYATGNIGRLCRPADGAERPNYIAYPISGQPGGWLYFADLGPPQIADGVRQNVELCRVFALNYGGAGSVSFDDLLFVRIEMPETRER